MAEVSGANAARRRGSGACVETHIAPRPGLSCLVCDAKQPRQSREVVLEVFSPETPIAHKLAQRMPSGWFHAAHVALARLLVAFESAVATSTCDRGQLGRHRAAGPMHGHMKGYGPVPLSRNLTPARRIQWVGHVSSATRCWSSASFRQ